MEIIVNADRPRTCVVIGASHAGTTLALQLRREGWQGPIKLIGAEYEQPYHRPPLSKDYLAGSKQLEQIRLRPAKTFKDNEIDLQLGNTVLSLDAESRTVHLQDGDVLRYDKLALCTGSHVRTLTPAPDVPNVFYVRTLADVTPLRDWLKPEKRVAIIGAGYIGLEMAAVMVQLGMQVTVIERESRVLARVASEPLSEYLRELHTSKGVEILCDRTVTGIDGEKRAETVMLSNGTQIPVDLVVVGIGVEPNVTLAQSAGLTLNDGIVVDEYTRTSHPDIFAAGDCTQFPCPLYGRRLRLESVQNANDQARVAAANINGRKTIYNALPWFWSDQYTIKLQSAGLQQGFDSLVRRDHGEDSFVLFYLQGSQLLAADCINSPKEFLTIRKLMEARQEVPAEQLADSACELSDLLDK